MMIERDRSIDIIRGLGLICIILAHVNPPFFIFQVRNFDVPLMVFISGFLFGDKNQEFKSIADITSYLWKRFVRLVVPVWAFLTLFYSIQYCFPYLFKVDYTQYPHIILSSYMLMDGFGYVWIIRIFLMIAILGPLCSNFIKNKWQLLLYYVIYEIVIHYSKNLFEPTVQRYIDQFGSYSLGFLLFFMLGAQYKDYTSKTKITLFMTCMVITILGMAYTIFYLDKPFDIGSLKYPPRSFYIYYAIIIFSIIFWIKPRLRNINVTILNFIGSSTIWIYLWHILFIFLINFKHWYLNWIIIIIFSMVLTYLQQRIVSKAITYFQLSDTISKQLRIIFCS